MHHLIGALLGIQHRAYLKTKKNVLNGCVSLSLLPRWLFLSDCTLSRRYHNLKLFQRPLEVCSSASLWQWPVERRLLRLWRAPLEWVLIYLLGCKEPSFRFSLWECGVIRQAGRCYWVSISVYLSIHDTADECLKNCSASCSPAFFSGYEWPDLLCVFDCRWRSFCSF